MSLFRNEVKRKAQRKLKQAFGKKQTVQKTRTAVIAGHNLLSIRGQIHKSSIVAGQVGDAVVVVNDGTASNAVYVPAAAGAGAGSFTSGTSSTVTAAGSGSAIDESAFLRKDGSIPLIGNLTVAGSVTIDGVDIGNPGDGIDIDASKRIAVDVDDIAGDALANDGSNNLSVIASALAGDGLTTDGANNLILRTPFSINVASTNVVTSLGHNHQILHSSNPGAASSILSSTIFGGLTLESFQSNGSIVALQGMEAGEAQFRVIHHTEGENHVHVIVNPSEAWSFDEQFGVDIDDNLLVRGWIVGKFAIQLDGATLIAHYDGPGPFETNYAGTPMGHMGQVPTVTGGVIYRPGKFQTKAVQLAKATTNLITNPSGEVNLTGWTFTDTGGGGALTLSATRVWIGTSAFRLQASSASCLADSNNITVANGTTIHAQAEFFRETSFAAYLIIRDVTNGQDRASAQATDTSDWEHLTASWTNNTGSSVTVRVRVRNDANDASSPIYFDGVQAETGTFRTPYGDGTLSILLDSGSTGGHTWTGTAHASTSTRNQALLSYGTQDVLDLETGTVMVWAKPEALTGGGQYAFNHTGITGSIFIRITAAGNWSALVGSDSSATTPATAGTWQHLCLSWDNGTAAFYVNGVLVDAAFSYGGLSQFDDTFYVGSLDGTTQWINGWIDDLVILDRAITADELRAVYESDAPVFAETATFHWRAGRNRVWADAEGLWMLNASGTKVLGAYAGDEENPAATKSWGGVSLAESDILIGDNSRGGYLLWDDSAATVSILGDLNLLSDTINEPDENTYGNNAATKEITFLTGTDTDAKLFGYYNATDNEAGANLLALAKDANTTPKLFLRAINQYKSFSGELYDNPFIRIKGTGDAAGATDSQITIGSKAITLTTGDPALGTITMVGPTTMTGLATVGGKLGVGVDPTASQPLTVHSDGAGIHQIRLENGSELAVFGVDSGGELSFWAHGANSTDIIEFKTGSGSGTRRAYIANDGKTAIGNITPNELLTVDGALSLKDGMSAPGTTAGYAKIYVDSATGDLMVKFGDGITKTLATDT